METAAAETEAELTRTKSALAAYESVGGEMDGIVDEFTRLRAEVDNRQWAVHELKKHSLANTDRRERRDDDLNAHSFLGPS